MLRAGLTGGIGCGKSTVAAMMRGLGCQVLDADRLARDLVETSQPAFGEIVAAFGPEILAADGHIDRRHLAHIVFSDPAKLASLNQIVHPRVVARQEQWLGEIAQVDPHAVAVIEAALLVEAGAHAKLDRLVVVWCIARQQMTRLTDPLGRAMSREDAQRRIAAQMPLDQKRRLATDEIDNSGSLEATRQQVADLVVRFHELAAGARA
jgi:dephospho-CoA kinase